MTVRDRAHYRAATREHSHPSAPEARLSADTKGADRVPEMWSHDAIGPQQPVTPVIVLLAPGGFEATILGEFVAPAHGALLAG
jgi:hypothetical protein